MSPHRKSNVSSGGGGHMLLVLTFWELKMSLGVCPQMSRLQHGDIWWFGESTVWGDVLAVLRTEAIPRAMTRLLLNV